jgi:hypothetical protein
LKRGETTMAEIIGICLLGLIGIHMIAGLIDR